MAPRRRGARRESSAPIRAMPIMRSAMRRRCARPASARRPPRCWRQPRCTIPSNKALLGAYGRALADAGNFKQALDVLERAHSPDQPDWRILSVQGAVLDQMGRHEEAQRYYASALKIVPDEPSVLSNLGLSYALSKDLKRAEETLRRASAKRRHRQARAAEPGAGGRAAGPLPGGRDHRACRSAAGRGRRQCRLSARRCWRRRATRT